MIKAIAFDYGGVIKLNDTNLFGDICDYLKINQEDWMKEYFLVNHLFNSGQKDYYEVIDGVIGKFTDKEEDKNYIVNLIKTSLNSDYLNTELLDFIKELKNKSYKIALLSNAGLKLKEKLAKDGILSLFDEVIISAEVGFQKPQPEIFDVLFKKLEVSPSEVIFIDDTERSLEGADKIGYKPILFKDNETFKEELLNILEIELK